MALNIKPFYPLDHPGQGLSVSELVKQISAPTSTAVYLKTELEKEETFDLNQDLYHPRFKPKWKQVEHTLNQKVEKLLDVI